MPGAQDRYTRASERARRVGMVVYISARRCARAHVPEKENETSARVRCGSGM